MVFGHKHHLQSFRMASAVGWRKMQGHHHLFDHLCKKAHPKASSSKSAYMYISNHLLFYNHLIITVYGKQPIACIAFLEICLSCLHNIAPTATNKCLFTGDFTRIKVPRLDELFI